mgnify:CR=1 FL=1
MPVNEKLWRKRREEAYKRLWEDLEIGYLDEDLLDILLEFFKRPESYTTSSCSGRIVVVDSRMPWERRDATIIFKKHAPISLDEIKGLLKQPVLYRLWLVASGPIIHVVTLTAKEALKVLRIAREAGFKHSGVMSASRKGYLVELRTGIRLAVLLKTPNGLVVNEQGLNEAIKAVNEALIEGKKRLNRLLKALRRHSIK